MNVDLSKLKVAYGNRLLRALCLVQVEFPDDTDYNAIHKKPKIIEILVINEDGNIEAIRDEAWMFQFIPAL